MNTLNLQKPCVVETPQGFSVSYKEHLLYSKYNPSKLIIQTVQNTEILPGTIILCFSPVLSYGLKELYEKLPGNCLIVLCEHDKELYELSYEQNKELYNLENLMYPTPEELNELPITLFNLCSSGKYKRVISIDFSAGVQFSKEYFQKLLAACINSVATFWKNRITLTKFGRKYSYNFFRNLHNLENSTPIENYFNRVSKPIIVFGAGQSLDLFFKNNNITPKDFFILCADTALQPLLKRNITPDGVFIEEAQNVILKAFIGSYSNIHIFAGLSSLPNLARFVKNENISYFTTEYTKAAFLDKLYKTNFLPAVNQPFGSVGITAVYYALKFRKDDTVPVYVCGLDFSYSLGFTHAKGTLAHTTRLINNNKLYSVENHNAFFSSHSIPFLDKNKNIFVTTPTLKTYGDLFNNLFSSTTNLFDAGDCGYPLGIIQARPLIDSSHTDLAIKQNKYTTQQKAELMKYLLEEKTQLLYLRDLLTGKIKLSNEDRINEIKKTAAQREYLYLHFPDGYCFTYSQSFLNRIRTEIDFFLKVFE